MSAHALRSEIVAALGLMDVHAEGRSANIHTRTTQHGQKGGGIDVGTVLVGNARAPSVIHEARIQYCERKQKADEGRERIRNITLRNAQSEQRDHSDEDQQSNNSSTRTHGGHLRAWHYRE